MFNLKQSLVAAAGAALVALFAASAAHAQKGGPPETAPPPQNVKVVNTPSEPVPVTGTVSVSNLGTDPLPVRDVNNPARQLVQSTLPFIVPAGKRLVIEYYSARYVVAANCQLTIANVATQLDAQDQDTWVIHEVTPTLTASTATNTYYSVSQQMLLYAGPGTQIIPNGIVEGAGCHLTSPFLRSAISGYLVDVPQE